MYHVALFILLANLENGGGITRVDRFSLRQRDISAVKGIGGLSVVLEQDQP